MERRRLSGGEVAEKLKELDGWTAIENRLVRRYSFANFAESLAFVNRVGEIAEAADHHPDITFGWGYAEISTTTHDRSGLTDFDFDLVKKIDAI